MKGNFIIHTQFEAEKNRQIDSGYMFNNKRKVEFPFLEIWKNRTWFHNIRRVNTILHFFFQKKRWGSFSHPGIYGIVSYIVIDFFPPGPLLLTILSKIPF